MFGGVHARMVDIQLMSKEQEGSMTFRNVDNKITKKGKMKNKKQRSSITGCCLKDCTN